MKILKPLTLLLINLLFMPLILNAATFTEGKDYKVISSSKATSQKGVIEFFSYGCPWCFELEKSVEAMAKTLPKATSFKRVPVTFEPHWELYAKAYYTARALKMEDQLTPLLFNAIQEDDKLSTEQEMIEFFVSHGANKDFVTSAFSSSPTMDALVKNGTKLMRQYQVYAVPSFVVNERYKTDLALVKGDKKKLIAVVNYLATKD